MPPPDPRREHAPAPIDVRLRDAGALGVRETGKSRAKRIGLDYFRSGDPITRTKNILALLACLAAGAVVLASVNPVAFVQGRIDSDQVFTPLGRKNASHGPVAAAHAAWEEKCEACHVPFVPIRQQTGVLSELTGTKHPTNQQCEKCHAGPAHHPNQRLDQSLSCAYCHRDHRGRDASLVRLDDRQCTICHADLSKQAIDPALIVASALKVTSFPNGHPEFTYRPYATRVKSTATEAAKKPYDFEPKLLHDSRLKFSHGVHLTKGLPRRGDSKTEFWKYADIKDPAERARYKAAVGATDDRALVELDCRSCHALDPADQSKEGGQSVVHTTGMYYLPVVYERHCQACHTLEVPRRPAEYVAEMAAAADPKKARAAEGDPAKEAGDPAKADPARQAGGEVLEIRHGLQVEPLKRLLEEAYVGTHLLSTSDRTTPLGERLRMPGKVASKEEAKTYLEAIARDVELGLGMLFVGEQTCGKCHEYVNRRTGKIFDPTPRTDHAAASQQVKEALTADELSVVKPLIPETWQPTARFNHTAHRALDCKECHADHTKDGLIVPMTLDFEVRMPGKWVCARCHAPTFTEGGQNFGGVSHACTDCHAYHHVDRTAPLPGAGHGGKSAGSHLYDPIEQQSIRDWLSPKSAAAPTEAVKKEALKTDALKKK